VLAAGSIVLLTLNLALAPEARAAEFFVNNASASCSDAGPGTAAAPYCTITGALTAHHEPGVIITVMPGRYREQVTLPASGLAGSPITLRAQPGAIVDGTDDFSDPARWAPFSGDVWLASSVTAPPLQVFADDQRLTASTAPPASLPPRSFTFVAGSGLYVHAGGGNPGTHRTQVGRRLRGIFASGKSFIVIQGFTVTRCEDRCIQLTNSSDIRVQGNTLTFSGKFGLQANGDTRDQIVGNRSFNNAGHGFSLIGTVETTVEDNEAFDNADPNIRVANGLFVGASARNVIRRNRWHHNQDSGQQFSPDCADNVSLLNRSWANGDHGYDHNRTTGTLHLHDVAYGNFKDGFSIEGSSTGTRMFNCISIENGVTTNEYDLWVDSLSTPGFQSNDNILWNSGPQPPVKIGNSVYPTVSGYAAGRAQDTRSVQGDPMFVNAAGGDFRLRPGSPAIDNANSGVAGWPSMDAEGNARADDPGKPNRGIGPVTFADRGALEFQGASPSANQPPSASLTGKPTSGAAPLRVHLSAGGSSDPEGGVLSYRFEFGDGATEGPRNSPEVNHTYAAGSWTAKVTVTDDKGATATATANIVASGGTGPPANLVGNGTFEANASGWAAMGEASMRRTEGGHGGAFALLLSAPVLGLSSYGVTDQPSWVPRTGGAGTRYHVRAWVRAELGAGLVSLSVRESHSSGASFTHRSPSITLGSGWTALELDVTTQRGNSALDLSIVSAPSVVGSAFRVDDVSITEQSGRPAQTAVTEGVPDSEPENGPVLAPGVHPNPVGAGGARIVFSAGGSGPSEVSIFDLAGRVVRRLAAVPTAADGAQFVAFDGRAADGRRLPGGVYYYQVRIAGTVSRGRFVIVE
jgi:hypothetical protein